MQFGAAHDSLEGDRDEKDSLARFIGSERAAQNQPVQTAAGFRGRRRSHLWVHTVVEYR
jgi:hypothetical protein